MCDFCDDFSVPSSSEFVLYIMFELGSGCGAVGRAIASYTRDPRFESIQPWAILFTINSLK